MNNQEGDGLCCANGSGHYEMYSKGKLLFTGNEYGAIKEHFFSIDPSLFTATTTTSTENHF